MKLSRPIKISLLIVPVIILFYVLRTRINFADFANIEYLRDVILSFGILSPLVYILIMAVAIVVSPIPSMPLTAASGIIWGPYLGAIYSIAGAEIGAIISFLIARNLGGAVIEKIFHMDISFCDKYSGKRIGLMIFIARLLPFFQFDIISYGAGLTRISLRYFALATLFGMTPMTLLFAFFGKSFFIGNFLSVTISLILIAAIFIVPMLIKRYNLFGLKKDDR